MHFPLCQLHRPVTAKRCKAPLLIGTKIFTPSRFIDTRSLRPKLIHQTSWQVGASPIVRTKHGMCGVEVALREGIGLRKLFSQGFGVGQAGVGKDFLVSKSGHEVGLLAVYGL